MNNYKLKINLRKLCFFVWITFAFIAAVPRDAFSQDNPIVTVVASAEEENGQRYVKVNYVLRETSVIQVDRIEIIDEEVNFYELEEADVEADIDGDLGYTEVGDNPETKTFNWYFTNSLIDNGISGKLKVTVYLNAKSSKPASIKIYLGNIMPQYENQEKPVILSNYEGPTDNFKPYTGLSFLGTWHTTLPGDAKFYAVGAVTDFPVYRHSSQNFYGKPTLPSGSSFFAYQDETGTRKIWINAAAGKMQGPPDYKKLWDFQIHYTGDETSGTAVVGIAQEGSPDLESTSTTDATLELEYGTSDPVASNEVEIDKKPSLELVLTPERDYSKDPAEPEEEITINLMVQEPDDNGNLQNTPGANLFVKNEIEGEIQFSEIGTKTDASGKADFKYTVPQETEYGLYKISIYADNDDDKTDRSATEEIIIKVAPPPDVEVFAEEETYKVKQDEILQILLTAEDDEGPVEDARITVINGIEDTGQEVYIGKTGPNGKYLYEFPVPEDTPDDEYDFTFFANKTLDEDQKSLPEDVRVIVGDIPVLLISIEPNTSFKLKPNESEKIDINIREEKDGDTIAVEGAEIYIKDGLNDDISFRPLGMTDASGMRKYDILVPEDKEQGDYEIKFYATKEDYADSEESTVKVDVSVDSCWTEGAFEFCTKDGWEEKEGDPVIKANGEVLINNLITFVGNMEINKETLKMTANGSFVVKDVPKPGGGTGDITIMSGNLVDVELLGGNGTITKLANKNLTKKPAICGVQIDTISNIKLLGGVNASGIEISATLKVPGFSPGCSADGKKNEDVSIKINGLKVMRNSGMYFDGLAVSNLSPAPKFCINEIKYNYDQKKDRLDLGCQFKVPFMKVGAGAAFQEAQIDSIGFSAEVDKGIPIAQTGVCIKGIRGKAAGLSFPPLELSFGGKFINCLNADLMEITADAGYKAPSTIFISGTANFIKLPGTKYWQITGKPEIKFDYTNAILKLNTQLQCGTFDGKTYILNGKFDMGYKAEESKFTGKVNGSITIPKLPFKGFPYDMITNQLGLPYTASMNGLVNMSSHTKHIYAECDFQKLGKMNFQLDLTKPTDDTEFFYYYEGEQIIPSITSKEAKDDHPQSGEEAIAANIERSFDIPANTEWMYVRINSSGQVPDNKLEMPDGTELTETSQDSTVIHFDSDDNMTSFWSIASPQAGTWKVHLIDGSEDDLVEVYYHEHKTAFSLAASQEDKKVTISWDAGPLEPTDTVELYLDDNIDGYDGIKIAEIPALQGSYIFTLADSMGYCRNYVYAYVQTENEELKASGYAEPAIINDKSSLPPPHDIKAGYRPYTKMMTVEWIPNDMANVAGYYVIVTDGDGNDSTYAIAFSNETEVSFHLEDYENSTVRVAAIDTAYRSGCPSEPLDFVLGIQNKPVAGLDFDESRIQIVPNPVTEKTEIKFNLVADSYVRLGIYDLFGNRIASLADGFYSAGVLTSDWNASGTSSGTYMVRLEAEGKTTSQLLVIMK